ncbi:hypothetical protein EVAR_56263_1 [Eumeta japonica]|uniref:Uncharacterized protein n=1 Tax=Eumeta variegata TaxID=151549 RepID=A0A4C1YJH6_EUMVA|nr:hypothetical protein EVAR_56263_1 [Eumeta japonica]
MVSRTSGLPWTRVLWRGASEQPWAEYSDASGEMRRCACSILLGVICSKITLMERRGKENSLSLCMRKCPSKCVK